MIGSENKKENNKKNTIKELFSFLRFLFKYVIQLSKFCSIFFIFCISVASFFIFFLHLHQNLCLYERSLIPFAEAAAMDNSGFITSLATSFLIFLALLTLHALLSRLRLLINSCFLLLLLLLLLLPFSISHLAMWTVTYLLCLSYPSLRRSFHRLAPLKLLAYHLEVECLMIAFPSLTPPPLLPPP